MLLLPVGDLERKKGTDSALFESKWLPAGLSLAKVKDPPVKD